MRKILIVFLMCLAYFLQSQVVEDYAGVSTVEGFNDSTRLQALINNPHGLHLDKEGNLYIADRFNHAIRKVDVNGQMTTLAGTGEVGSQDGAGAQATFFEPWDITTDDIGNVYVADAKNNKIRKIDTAGIVSTYAGTGSAGFKDDINLLSGTFFWPSSIEYDQDQDCFYIAGHLSHLIRKIDEQNGLTTLAGSKNDFPDNFGTTDGIGTQARFYRPYGLHLSDDGYIYVADEWNSNIRKVSKEGVVTTIAGISNSGYQEGGIDSSTFNFPWDITTDRNNLIYVLDGFNHVIRTIDPVTFETRLFAGTVGVTGAANNSLLSSTFNGATGLAYKRATGQLFIADAYNNVVRTIDLLETPSLSIAEVTPFCEGDSITITADIDYYSNYFWSINGVFFERTSSKTITILPESTPITITVNGQRPNGSLSADASINFNKSYDSVCQTVQPISAIDDTLSVEYYQEHSLCMLLNDLIDNQEVSVTIQEPLQEEFEVENQCLSISDWGLIDTSNYVIDYKVCYKDYPNICDEAVVQVNILNLTDNDVFIFPNAISPNQDGLNDVFVVLGLNVPNDYQFLVYNRWGELVKSIDNYSNNWDGTQHQDNPLPEGTYFYLLSNKTKTYSGYVLIYR